MTIRYSHFSHSAFVASMAAIFLSACGGGGDAINTSSETATGRMSNAVASSTSNVGAGQSTTLEATAIAKGVAPSTMVWSVAPLSIGNANDPAPTLSDSNCANATYAAAISAVTTGRGYCQVILTAPANSRTGVWRVTNTATANGIGVASHYVDIGITAMPDTGFRVVESSAPVVGYVNTMLPLTLPWTVNPGVAVSNVTYLWEDDSQNPTASALAGASNPSATAVVSGTGMYRFKLTVTADINGRRSSASGAFMALVYRQADASTISAGDPKVAAYNEAVSLVGEIRNADPTALYSVVWTQIDGLAGGPARVALSNVNTLQSGFVAPTTAGLYGFEMSVVKTRSDGTQVVTKAQTTVLVQALAAATVSH